MHDNRTDAGKSLESFFQRTEEAYPKAQAAYQKIVATIDEALQNQNLEQLISIIQYIEEEEGALAYHYIGEARRILRILHIIRLERKYQKILFSSGCINKDELLEKYMISLFAFRRLLFQLSNTSMEEAVSFFEKNKLSIYAVYTITKEDLFIPDDFFFKKMADIYLGFWNEEDVQLLYSLHKQLR